ncbi:MAG TPA: hypothetical protein PLX97_16715 [Gemmatales bacterium]|nr:hypothetical protein [Gemmatales bacterium]
MPVDGHLAWPTGAVSIAGCDAAAFTGGAWSDNSGGAWVGPVGRASRLGLSTLMAEWNPLGHHSFVY